MTTYLDPKNQVIDITTTQGMRDKIQQEALRAVLPHRKSGLHISMGVGKTYIGLQYVSIIKGKVLVVAPKVSIFESWRQDAQKFSLDHLLNDITFTTYLSLHKHNPEDYNILILDEAHNTKYSHEPFLSEFKGSILGLSGTPPRYKNGEKGEMMETYYPIRYQYTVDEAVDSDILNDYRIFVHLLPLSDEKTIKTKQGWYTSERKQYDWISQEIINAPSEKQVMFKRIMRINYLKQFSTKERFVKLIMNSIPTEEKCLVFANTTEQADNLCENSYHSKQHKTANSQNLVSFASGEIRFLSAVEQLSEGISIPNLKHIVILHAYGNEKRASQKIGRALRLSADQTAYIHILCYNETVDEDWVQAALKDFDEEKITHIYRDSNFKRINN
jgi:superfamily II DNA or RNA helicase